MNGIVARRNNPVYWKGRVTWARLRLKTLPPCDDCVVNAHDQGGTTVRIARARHRRKNTVYDGMGAGMELFTATNLCDPHRDEWAAWTPGQLAIGS